MGAVAFRRYRGSAWTMPGRPSRSTRGSLLRGALRWSDRGGEALGDDPVVALRGALDRALDNDRVRRRFGLAVRQYRAVRRDLGRLDPVVPEQVAELHVRALVGESRCMSEQGAATEACLALLAEARWWAEMSGEVALVALVDGRRGLLRLRRGQLDEALTDLSSAEKGLPDGPDLGAVYLNRGSLRLERGETELAARDFERCVSMTGAGVEPALHAMAAHNLGYALFLRGELPAALRSMADAARGAPPEHAGVGLMDKAAVLYEAGLLTDAEESLRQAGQLLSSTAARRDLLDARLARARCLVGLERHQEALALARSVRASARRTGDRLLELRADLIGLDARHGQLIDDGSPPARVRRLARTAEQVLDAAGVVPGGARLAADVSLVAADALARAGDFDAAVDHLRHLPTRSGLALGTRLRAEAVRALVAFGQGDRRAGVAAIRRGQELLAQQRQRLGAVEAVTAAAAHGVRLQAVDIVAALDDGRADALFDALERGRATFAGSGRVRPSADRETAALVSAARRLLDRARMLEAEKPDSSHEASQLRREARRLQDRARERSWQVGGEAEVPRAATVRAIRAELRAAASDRVVLNLALYQGRVLAVRVDRFGAQVMELGHVAEVVERARRVRADQYVLANPLIPEPMRAAALRSLERDLAWLDTTLLRGVDPGEPLYVAARGRLVSLPWASLPSRRGTSTVVNSWVARGTAEWSPGTALVVAGPELRHAPAEADAVATVWGAGTTVLTGESATCDAVAGELDGHAIVHLAAHGQHEPDNPVFSSVRLADGPMFAHELDGTDLARCVMVLSACDVGSVSIKHGGEPLGLTSVLLRMGARAVIASVAPLRDEVAVRVMPALHRGLREGLRPGEALARAVADEPEPVPLVCFGPLVL
ncbi:CHAT domain-containing protein [Isoptericola sp. NPDC019693]|uniref:CHAT domain-containing protein n=1 Tax=Isoptericola sp. NPDC019693 TaxID=3364009 RepID=UPI0037A6AA8E